MRVILYFGDRVWMSVASRKPIRNSSTKDLIRWKYAYWPTILNGKRLKVPDISERLRNVVGEPFSYRAAS